MVRHPAFRRLWLWGPPIVYMAVIFHFSSESNPLPDLTAHVWDKLLHMIEYTGLGFLCFRALHGEGLRGWRPAVITVIMVSAYGASDEFHQMFVPMRSSDVNDWLTDTLSGLFGSIAFVAFSTLARQPRRLQRSRPGR